MTSNTVEIQKPERLGVSQTPEGLMQIEIQLRKFRLTVQENDFGSRRRLGSLWSDLIDKFNPEPKDEKEPEPIAEEEQYRYFLLQNVWAPLAACSVGEVPTADQFIKLPEIDIDFWMDTGRSLGIRFDEFDRLQKLLSGETLPTEKEAKKNGRKSRRK